MHALQESPARAGDDMSWGKTPVSRRVGMKAFSNLANRWKLDKGTWHVLLGRNSPNTIRNWIHDAEKGDASPLDFDVQERLSHLLSIYDGLHRLFGDAEYADQWVHTPNRAFGGEAPLQRMLTGRFSDLYDVRLYIERALAL